METEIKDPDLLRMENVREFGKFSFDLEEKREQSILNQSSQMLTAFSLFSAAILMALPIMTEYSAIITTSQTMIGSGFISFLLCRKAKRRIQISVYAL